LFFVILFGCHSERSEESFFVLEVVFIVAWFDGRFGFYIPSIGDPSLYSGWHYGAKINKWFILKQSYH